ncbi:hypothetical protein [Pseudothauera rhizosphaerae]|uniref:hypothetical protein n=1 Tax=Pseudothauera rhizosphaerae TaxID=2565932 RepID=UPI001454DEFA|nr:hypothetical protein [Pseudothauera rhizosphaerae]
MTAPRLSDRWLIHWLEIEPTICRYQQPVPLSRVLAEHAAAIAAEPVDDMPAATNITRN